MLVEALEYLITPCPPWARRLGYLTQAVGLRARHRRLRARWRPHLEACRSFILETMAAAPGRGRAVVLGSGLLLDVPVAALAAEFREVILVDAVHLVPERLRARRWPHVRMIAADVTGAVAAPAGMLPPPGPPAGLAGLDCDFVVSANMLSQLPLALLARPGAALDAVARTAFARGLIERHLDHLRELAPLACLIADRESLILDGDTVIDREDLLSGAILPAPGREWWWELAPRPELYRRYDVRHRVGGFALAR